MQTAERHFLTGIFRSENFPPGASEFSFDRKPLYTRGLRNMFKIVVVLSKYVRASFLTAFLDQRTFPQEPLIFLPARYSMIAVKVSFCIKMMEYSLVNF